MFNGGFFLPNYKVYSYDDYSYNMDIVDKRINFKLRQEFPKLLSSSLLTDIIIQDVLKQMRETVSLEAKNATEKTINEITNNEIHKEAVFGSFKRQLKNDCDDTLKNVKEELLQEVRQINNNQTYIVIGLGCVIGYLVGKELVI